jgi:hypothetical protein
MSKYRYSVVSRPAGTTKNRRVSGFLAPRLMRFLQEKL